MQGELQPSPESRQVADGQEAILPAPVLPLVDSAPPRERRPADSERGVAYRYCTNLPMPPNIGRPDRSRHHHGHRLRGPFDEPSIRRVAPRNALASSGTFRPRMVFGFAAVSICRRYLAGPPYPPLEPRGGR